MVDHKQIAAWQQRDTPMASVGKRVQTLRIVAFAVMQKHDKGLREIMRVQEEAPLPCIDVECLETLIFGASPP